MLLRRPVVLLYFLPDYFLNVPQQRAQLRVLAVNPAPLPRRAALLPQLLEEEAEVWLLCEGVPVSIFGCGCGHTVHLQQRRSKIHSWRCQIAAQ